jgi:uncharacterized membrane protein YdbT with pleckstrin-like domain
MNREPGERIIFCDHPCFRATPGRHVRTVLLAVAAGVVAGLAQTLSAGHAETTWVAPAVAAVLLLRFGRAVLRRHATLYTVTDRRLVLERGLLRRRTVESPLGLVMDVSCRQNLRERILRVGTVEFATAEGPMTFRHVEEPQRLARTVEQAGHARERVAGVSW